MKASFLIGAMVIIAMASCNGSKSDPAHNADSTQFVTDSAGTSAATALLASTREIDSANSERMLSSIQDNIEQKKYRTADEIIDSLLLDKVEDKVRDKIMDKLKELLTEHAEQFEEAEHESGQETSEKASQYSEKIAEQVTQLTRDDYQKSDLQREFVTTLTQEKNVEKLKTILASSYSEPDLHSWLNEMSDNGIFSSSELEKFIQLCTCTER